MPALFDDPEVISKPIGKALFDDPEIVEQKPAGGFLDTLGSDLKALPGAVAGAVMHPGLTANAIAANSAQHLKNAHASYQAGNYEEALNHVARAIPLIGDMAKDAEADLYAGNTGRALARMAELAIPEAADHVPGIMAKLPEAAAGTGAFVRAAAPGLGKGMLKVGSGAAADAGIGAVTGAHFPVFSTYLGLKGGGVEDIGAGLKAGLQAGRDASAKVRLTQEIAARGARPAPAWQLSPDIARPVPGQPEPIGVQQFPSGRAPGGIQNQVETAAPVAQPMAVVPKTAAPVDPMDTIAAELGYKKPYAELKAGQQLEVRVAQKVAAQEAAKAAEDAVDQTKAYDPAKDQTPFGKAFASAVETLKGKGALRKDWKPSPLYDPAEPATFDSGSTVLIDSSKSRFNKPVANPSTLKPGQPELVISSIEKLANPSAQQRLLLKQMREEVKKRSTK